MTIYIGLDEDDVEDAGGCAFTNMTFWNLKEKIYETLTKEEAKRYNLFIELMNAGTVKANELDKLQVELEGLIAKFADEDSTTILNDIFNVAKYAKDKGKDIIMN